MSELKGDVRYKIGRKSTGEESVSYSAPLKLTEVDADLRPREKSIDPPLQLRRRDTDFGPFRTIPEANKRAIAYLNGADIGDFVIIRGGNKNRLLIVRKVLLKPEIVDTDGTNPIDVMHTEVFKKWPQLVSFGICSCRDVAGSSTPSQHSFCNAEDIHGSPSLMYTLSRYLVKYAGRLDVAHVIYNRQAYTSPSIGGSGGWSYYSGINPHYDHVHVDMLPQRSGACLAPQHTAAHKSAMANL